MELLPTDLAARSPAPDREAEPDGFVVEIAPGERIHFLDWGRPVAATQRRAEVGVLLIHGLAGTAWAWTAVARRLRPVVRTVAMDLRGHGLSDAPTDPYDPTLLADDAIAAAEGSGLLGSIGVADRGVVLVGHGFGAMVAAWAVERLGDRCAGLVLIDGGWQDVAAETGLTPAEWLRDLAEPPEVMASMTAFLDDRRAWDPGHWDADEERAARATVVAVPAGHLVPAIRPHAMERSVEALFQYRPTDILPTLDAPILAAMATDDDERTKTAALAELDAERRATGRGAIDAVRFPADGHNLPRYRPAELAGAILELVDR
jgi:pimeloyl-ACP methyl ester carboxylesterase